MEIVFFDLETTGVKTSKDRIVSLSAFKTDENFVRTGYFIDLIINPTIPIPKDASNVHGITDEMVKDLPTFKDQYPMILEFFGYDSILCGYNSNGFDIPLLCEEFSRCGISWPSPDFKSIDAKQIFFKKERRDLTAALKFYTGKEMTNAHDAQADINATLEVLQGQIFMYELSINDCMEMSKSDSLDFAGKIILIDGEPCYSFGKHQNQKVKDYPSFGIWMIDPKQDFTSNTKNTVKRILNIK